MKQRAPVLPRRPHSAWRNSESSALLRAELPHRHESAVSRFASAPCKACRLSAWEAPSGRCSWTRRRRLGTRRFSRLSLSESATSGESNLRPSPSPAQKVSGSTHQQMPARKASFQAPPMMDCPSVPIQSPATQTHNPTGRTEKACKRRPFRKRLMGFEPTTFCMASRRSSQLSYSRARRGSIAATIRW